jgi:hypothetical protein
MISYLYFGYLDQKLYLKNPNSWAIFDTKHVFFKNRHFYKKYFFGQNELTCILRKVQNKVYIFLSKIWRPNFYWCSIFSSCHRLYILERFVIKLHEISGHSSKMIQTKCDLIKVGGENEKCLFIKCMKKCNNVQRQLWRIHILSLCWRETIYFMLSLMPVGEFKSSTEWAENSYIPYLKSLEPDFCSSKYHRKSFIPHNELP